MKVNQIATNILCLEYRQEREDKDYGSCLWARFYFNLNRYELMIMSDCGNYGYKWCETPDSERFLELMARCEGGYILDKIYGRPDIFDYDATKEKLYDLYGENKEAKAKLDEIFEGIEGESLLLLLDDKGIQASSGSACTSGSLDPSHVLLAIGRVHDVAHGSLRLSLGEDITEEQVDYIIKSVKDVVSYLRGFSPVWRDLMSGKGQFIL